MPGTAQAASSAPCARKPNRPLSVSATVCGLEATEFALLATLRRCRKRTRQSYQSRKSKNRASPRRAVPSRQIQLLLQLYHKRPRRKKHLRITVVSFVCKYIRATSWSVIGASSGIASRAPDLLEPKWTKLSSRRTFVGVAAQAMQLPRNDCCDLFFQK